MTEPKRNVVHYRKQAEDARQLAGAALTQEGREGYLKLALDWDKLADEIETGTFGSARTPR
jgi:hypothetical protein